MKNFSFFILATFVFMSCQSESKKKKSFNQKWAYTSIEINGELKDARSLNFPTIEFTEDSQYILEYGGVSEHGTWSMKSDSSFVTKVNDNNFSQELVILKLSEDTFRLKSANKNDDLILTLVPIQNKQQ